MNPTTITYALMLILAVAAIVWVVRRRAQKKRDDAQLGQQQRPGTGETKPPYQQR